MDGLLEKIDDLEATFDRREPELRAFLLEPDRFRRLRKEAQRLIQRYPSKSGRPPLFGQLAGIKDIFHVDGYETRAGSHLPTKALTGRQAESVSLLRSAGALIIGKTVTTEFAYFAPGPTRNPANPAHTPGGSSSGSAAASAAGLCDFALGTQTIGSINRPAAFCGAFGFKPTYNRIPTQGVIPLAPSFDHVGVLSADFDSTKNAAAVLCTQWNAEPAVQPPRLGIPSGPYLEQTDRIGTNHYRDTIARLQAEKVPLIEVPLLEDFERVMARHRKILAYEAAETHTAWYDSYHDLYHEKTRELIEEGQQVQVNEYRALIDQVFDFRNAVDSAMENYGIAVWITPSAPGPAPAGLGSTGDPVMNLPWTQAGLPTLTVPTGKSEVGLPLGTQFVGRRGMDEALFRHVHKLLPDLRG